MHSPDPPSPTTISMLSADDTINEDGHITPFSFASGPDEDNYDRKSPAMTPLAIFSKSMRDLQEENNSLSNFKRAPKTFVFPIPEIVETVSPDPEATENFAAGKTIVKPDAGHSDEFESQPIATTNPSILPKKSIKSPAGAWPFAGQPPVSPPPVSAWLFANKPPVSPTLPISSPPDSQLLTNKPVMSPPPNAWPFAHKPPSSLAKFPSIHARTSGPSSLNKPTATPLVSGFSLAKTQQSNLAERYPQPTVSLLPPTPPLLQQSTSTKKHKAPSQLCISSSRNIHNQLHSPQQLAHPDSSPLGSPVHDGTMPLLSPLCTHQSPSPSPLVSPVFVKSPALTRMPLHPDASPMHIRKTPPASPVSTIHTAASPSYIRKAPPIITINPSPEHGHGRVTAPSSPGHDKTTLLTSAPRVRKAPSLLTSPIPSKSALLSPISNRKTPLASPLNPRAASACDDIHTVSLEPGRFDAASIYSMRSHASLGSCVVRELAMNQENGQVTKPVL